MSRDIDDTCLKTSCRLLLRWIKPTSIGWHAWDRRHLLPAAPDTGSPRTAAGSARAIGEHAGPGASFSSFSRVASARLGRGSQMSRQISKAFASMASWLSKWMGSPVAVLVAAVLVAIALVSFGIDKTNITISIATLLMVFILQNSQNRDSSPFT
jgi:hypothetical protein